MKRRTHRWLFGAALFASLLGAERAEAAPPPEEVVLIIDSLPPGIDAEKTRTAIARELGRAVVIGTRADHPGADVIVVRADGADVVVVFDAEARPDISRTLELPDNDAEAIEAIALLAANLARDEAAELARSMKGAPGEVPPLPADPTPEHDPAAPAPERAPTVVVITVPRQTPKDRPVPTVVSQTGSCEAGAAWVPAGVDFLPWVGVSTAVGKDAARSLSFNVLGGISGGISGAEIGGVVNIAVSFVCGVQIGGVANITAGPLRGVQIGGVANVTAKGEGAQFGAVNVATGGMAGAQTGAVNVATGPLSGAQFGAANLAVGASAGAQFGATNVVVGSFVGAQFGAVNLALGDRTGAQFGAVNASKGLALGWQAGAVNVSGRGLSGVQTGAVNLSLGRTTGAQIGAVNISSGDMRGIQIGAVNIARNVDFAIGALTIVRHGRTHVSAWGTDTGVGMIGVKHGGTYFHTILGTGGRPDGEKSEWALGFGSGIHLPITDAFFADIDALGHLLIRTKAPNRTAMLLAPRAMLGYTIVPGISVTAGPSLNLLFSDDPETPTKSIFPMAAYNEGRAFYHLRSIWPGATIGVDLL